MTRRTILQVTQVMIAFHIEGDGEQDIKDLLKLLIQIGAFLWIFWQRANRKKRQFKGFLQDCRQAAEVAVSEITKLWTLDFGFTFGVG